MRLRMRGNGIRNIGESAMLTALAARFTRRWRNAAYLHQSAPAAAAAKRSKRRR